MFGPPGPTIHGRGIQRRQKQPLFRPGSKPERPTRGVRPMNGEAGAPNQDSRNAAVIVWAGGILLGFIPALIMYLVKKDDAFVQDQSKEAMNWFITGFLAYLAGMVLMIVLIGILVIAAVAICHLVFCIMGAISASKGVRYRTPFALRLLK
jgi:uncharacterized Tic20 family protein